MSKGDAARGSLHNDTYYGAIEHDGEIKYVKRVELASLNVAQLNVDSFIKSIVDETVREIIRKAIAEKGIKEAIAGPIWMNEEKRIPIKKVRCYMPSVTSPLHIRQHRDQSVKEYKKTFHVANDRNYMMAIYKGKDQKGKEKSEFELVNMLEAARYFKTSNDKEAADYKIVPDKSTNGNTLA